ncbi:MAG: TonB-dependent receptor domain-containing protein, partial [Terriglobia bacterium]
TDPSGGVVPGATVTLTNVLTGVKWTTRTNRAGDYVILQAPPGQYTLEVRKPGFNTVREQEFALEVNLTATFNITLPVGTSMQSVTVKAAGTRVDSSSATLGTVIGEQEVNSLPLNGRDFSMLLTLSPGASPINTDQNSSGWGTGAVGEFSFPAVNGQTNRSNMFWVDGVNDYGSFLSAYAVAPVLDDIAEFKDVTQSDQAQFGGVTGAMANVVTKSGTNLYHGDLWDFIENGAFNARDFFLPTVGQFSTNQFGGTIGGPLVIPHLYNGRNKTFFFLAYEGFRKAAPAQNLYIVPTAAELAGDLNDGFNPFPIYNPYTTRPDPNSPGGFLRDPFPNNQIPANLIDPKMVQYAETILPKPVNTGISAGEGVPNFNGIDDSPTSTSNDEGTLRLDEVLGSKDRLFGRWTGVTQTGHGSAGFVGYKSFTYLHGDNIAAGWSHTFGPSGLLTVGYGRSSVSDNAGNNFPNVNGPALVQAMGLQSVLWSLGGHFFIPAMGIPGYATGGGIYSDLHPAAGNEWKVDFAKVYDKHTVQAGVDLAQNNLIFPCYFTGVSFCPFQTSNLETGADGSGLASFLLGIPTGAGLGAAPVYNTGGWVDGLYIQDQWKVSSRLTVNLGLRYDLPFNSSVGRASDRSNEVGNWDFNTGNYVLQDMAPPCSTTVQAPCIPGGTLPDHVILEPHPGQSLVNNPRDNFGPRVGLAYRLTPNTALRASYG